MKIAMKIIKKIGKPSTGNHLKEGLRLALVNTGILFIGGGIGLGLLYIAHVARKAGLPIPLPVWLIMLGIGIPCFVIWFQYGRLLGRWVRRVIRGITVGLIGDAPGFISAYILITMLPNYVLSQEIHKIILTILTMFIIMMPIMVVLGILDAKKAEAKK